MDEPLNVPRIASGIPNRVGRLKCLGNAVVRQQFYPIFKAIADATAGKEQKYKALYISAFDRMMENRKSAGKNDLLRSWHTGEDVFRWWIGDDPAQIRFDDVLEV